MDEDVFRALADPSRRALLDRLFERDGQTLSELVEGMSMTRFGVMKHLRLLEAEGLVTTHRAGREKLHYLNPVPIQLIADRWISKYAEPWARAMTGIKYTLETEPVEPKHIYETFIRTTPEKLWAALTDGNLTRQYYYGTTVVCDWKPGSRYSYQDGEGNHTLDGTILEIEPPKRLVMTFEMTHNELALDDRPSRVTWEIESMGEVCLLRLTHDDFDGETATFKGVQMGWNPILSGLKTLLETGTPLAIP